MRSVPAISRAPPRVVHVIILTAPVSAPINEVQAKICYMLPSHPAAATHSQGFGVYPCLTFTHSPVEFPVVPLSVTSRAVFYVNNNGFSDLEVSYRLPQHCPVDIAVAFPEGRQVLCDTPFVSRSIVCLLSVLFFCHRIGRPSHPSHLLAFNCAWREGRRCVAVGRGRGGGEPWAIRDRKESGRFFPVPRGGSRIEICFSCEREYRPVGSRENRSKNRSKKPLENVTIG